MAQSVASGSFATRGIRDYMDGSPTPQGGELIRLLRWEALMFDGGYGRAQRQEYYGYKSAAVSEAQEAGANTRTSMPSTPVLFVCPSPAGGRPCPR